MAYISAPPASLSEKVVSAVSNAFSAVLRTLVNMSDAQARMNQIQRMQDLTDKQLASKYGIKRDEIVQFVFRDKMML